MKRIDHRSRRVASVVPDRRTWLAWLACIGLATLAPACHSSPPTISNLPNGQVFLQLVPPTATVLVDERPLLVPRGDEGLRLAMPIGPHRIEVFAPGYFAAYRDIQVAVGAPLPLQIALRPDPDAVPDSTPARPFGPRPQPLDVP